MDALDRSAIHAQEPYILHGPITANSGHRDQHLVFALGDAGIAWGDQSGNGRSRQAQARLFAESEGRDPCARDQSH